MKNVNIQTETKLTVNLISKLTMSSREIAELCEKEHKNVKRDIVNLCSELEIDALKFERIYKDAKNREQVEYLLDKELTLTLISGYNAKMRHRIIQRWQELENQQGQQAIREDLLKHKRLAQKTWSDALKENRELQGKETKSFHYSNENLMLNEIVLGERRSFAEDELSPIDVQQLEEARTLNGALIKLDTPYKERKAKLTAWCERLATTIALTSTT